MSKITAFFGFIELNFFGLFCVTIFHKLVIWRVICNVYTSYQLILLYKKMKVFFFV